jgi:two-component system chemotaxis response regulator CheB
MNNRDPSDITLIVIGASAGGVEALKVLLSELPDNFPAALVIVQHIAANSRCSLAQLLDEICTFPIQEAEELEAIQAGIAYLAPANYHLMIEPDLTFAFSIDPPVCYSRPSIDVLFESAAELVGVKLIGIILTGANSDGSYGLKRIKGAGGVTVVQEPTSAKAATMPLAALEQVQADHVVTLEQLGSLLKKLVNQ